jgi:hypothetical protein
MTQERRAEDAISSNGEGDAPIAEGLVEADNRGNGVVVDLERLEQQAEELYLHRFVEHVKRVRGEHGRFLTLRAGDEIAIEAAGDGSADSLKSVLAEPDQDAPS